KGEPLELDKDGNVKSLKPGQYAETVMFSNGHCPKGKYTMRWDGSGEFDAHLGSTLAPEGPGKATVDVQGDKGIFLMLKKVDPADPPHNVRLLMPGFTGGDDEPMFHPVFAQRMSLYRCLRFMDWGATNDSPLKSWADRATPAAGTMSGPKGAPLEWMVA